LFRKERVEREMDEELRGYLDAAVNEKMRRGRAAKKRCGPRAWRWRSGKA